MTTAKETFNYIADLVIVRLQPEGRANAIASSFRQIGEIAGDEPILLPDAQAALAILGGVRSDDDGPTAARRRTCAELAALLVGSDGIPSPSPSPSPSPTSTNPSRYATVCRRVAAAFTDSADPRQQAMAKTATREVEELDEWYRTEPTRL